MDHRLRRQTSIEQRRPTRLTGIDTSIVDVLDIPRIEASNLTAHGDFTRVHIDDHQFFTRSDDGIDRRAGGSLNHGFGRWQVFEDVMHHTFDIDQQNCIAIEIGHQQTIIRQSADARRCTELAVFTIEGTREVRDEVIVLVLLQIVDQFGSFLVDFPQGFRLFRRGDFRSRRW